MLNAAPCDATGLRDDRALAQHPFRHEAHHPDSLLRRGATAPHHAEGASAQGRGLRHRRVAGDRRRLDRRHGRGGALARGRPHRPPDQQQGPRGRVPGGSRRRAEARSRRDRQHRRRQSVRRHRHPEAGRADRQRARGHGRRRPPGGDGRALLAGQEAAAAPRLMGRAPGVGNDDPGRHVRLPRLQP